MDVGVPVDKITQMLAYENSEETLEACHYHNLRVELHDGVQKVTRQYLLLIHML